MQHKAEAQAIAQLQQLLAKTQDGNRQARKESKTTQCSIYILTGTKASLSEVLARGWLVSKHMCDFV